MHVAVRQLRLQELIWMIKYGFENALVVKNLEGRTVSQLLGAVIKQLKGILKRMKRKKPAR